MTFDHPIVFNPFPESFSTRFLSHFDIRRQPNEHRDADQQYSHLDQSAVRPKRSTCGDVWTAWPHGGQQGSMQRATAATQSEQIALGPVLGRVPRAGPPESALAQCVQREEAAEQREICYPQRGDVRVQAVRQPKEE